MTPSSPVPTPLASRTKFGAFARLSPGTPPFSMFSSPGVLDADRTQRLLDLGVAWTRASLSPFFTDRGIFGVGKYDWSAADIVAGWTVAHGIEPVIGVEAGPVMVNVPPTAFAPKMVDVYASASAFASYCSAAAAHFAPIAHGYSEPGNETNTDPQKYPHGAADVAPFARTCYAAIHGADPFAFVWGLELNMDGQAGATAFVRDLLALGCGPGTCYDGISAHLSLRWPLRPIGTPCYPNVGGDYTVACIGDLQHASGRDDLPMMIGETVVTWPGMVTDAATQAIAAPTILRVLAAAPGVRYVNYANLDEPGLYPPGSYFANGSLIDANGNKTPAWEPVHEVYQNAR